MKEDLGSTLHEEKINHATVHGFDYPNDEDEKSKQLQDTLKKILRTLNNERAGIASVHKHGTDKPTLALEAIHCFVELLRMGRTSQTMLNLIANHLSKLDKKQALAFCKLKNHGRPNKKLNELRAIEAANQAKLDKKSQHEIELAAWAEYFPRRQYTEEVKKPQTEAGAFDHPYANMAEQTMDTVIRPILRRAGVIAPRTVGRPTKKSKGK